MANRLKRFSHWSASHRQRVLDREGVSPDDFGGFSRKRQRRVLDRALDHVTPSSNTESNVDITAPLTPDVLDREINSAVRAKFGGAEREYGKQNTASLQQDTNIDSWYQDYLNTLGKAQQSSKDFYGAMAGGDQVVPTAVPGDEASMAAANRATLANQMNSVLKSQGGAANDLYGSQQANAQLSKIGWHQDETKERKSISDQLADLMIQKGDYGNQLRGEARESERKYGLEQAAFGLDEFTATQNAANDAATLAANAQEHADTFLEKHGVTQAKWNGWTPDKRMQWQKAWDASPQSAGDQLSQAKLDYFNKHGYFPSTGKNGGGPTDKQKSDYRDNDNYWTSGLSNLRDDPTLTMSDLTAPTTAGGYGIPADIAEALVYWQNPKHPGQGGHLTPALKKRLKRLHVHFKDDGYKGIG